MSSSLLLSTILLAVLATTFSSTSSNLAQQQFIDDFGFDTTDDFGTELDAETTKRLWNSNDKEIGTNIGQVFHLVIPRGILGGDLHTYEAKQFSGSPLPSWLLFDKTTGTFWGVPLPEDVERLHITVRAIGKNNTVSDDLIVNVVEKTIPHKCSINEDSTILTLVIDRGVGAIKPKQRVIAINNIAKFFGLPLSAFTLKPQVDKDDIDDNSIILAGPGNLKLRTSKQTSFIELPVGCDGRLWLHTASLVHQLKQQARDGTISEVLGLPLIGWRVKIDSSPIVRAKRQALDGSGDDYDDYYDEEYDDYNDEFDENEQSPSVATPQTTQSTTTTTMAATETTPTHPHRHHHGETKISEDDIDEPVEHIPLTSPRIIEEDDLATDVEQFPSSTTTSSSTTMSTTTATTTTTTTTTTPATTTTEKEPSSTLKATITNEITSPRIESNPNEDDYYDEYGFEDDLDDDDNEEDDEDGRTESQTIVPEFTSPRQIQPETPTVELTTVKETIPPETQPPVTTTEEITAPVIVEDTETPTVTITETVPTTTAILTSTTTTTTTTTTTEAPTTTPTTTTTTTTSTTTTPTTPLVTEMITEEEETTSTMKSTTVRHISSTPRTTTVREITESIEYDTKNFAPFIENRIKQMSVIAGKVFRFVVPKDTFKDVEDGYNLTLEFLNANEQPVGKDSWVYFNPIRREIYGLPLEDDVSKYDYFLRATDREGAFTNENITIQVQQHKQHRVVNHEFTLSIRIEKQQEFSNYVDWSLKVLRALGRLYNTNMSEITVRHVNYTNDLAVFTWTNDTVPTTNQCPSHQIQDLFQVLTANDRGDPARELNLALAPQLRVKRVEQRGLGVCETPQIPVTPPTNFPPFLRNPVDHINATVGELLVFRVPDDTFYDPEDTDARMLNITLLTGDRQSIKSTNWLQFDNKNREFYGIPRKAGRSEYQLVCTDSAGLPATDSLEIVVYPAPKRNYNVEFSMTVETPYDTFINSASLQKKFVEKLQRIFGDRNASNIHLSPFKQKHDSTIITWYNKTLSTIKCPHDEINHLESILKSPDRGIAHNVHNIMDPEFPVSTIKVLPIGNCKITKPIAPSQPPQDRVIPDEIGADTATSDQYQYLMTFIIPAVIISIMLSLAAIAACVLYRRRRTGKMNVEEDGRQSYGNKGIPVIFQEELEEKPEPGTKAPVILKDEKPPLAPPEYSKSGSLKLNDDSEPYQPPPPFTRSTQENGRQPRPKPTPTYRKPPPYVPP